MSNQLNNYGQLDDVSTNGGTHIGIVDHSSNTPKKGGNPKDARNLSYNDNENVKNLINSPPVEVMSRLRPRTRASGTEDDEWSGSDTDDDTDDEEFLLKGSAKTAAKKKPSAKKKSASKKSVSKKSAAHSKTKPATKADVKRRGNNNGATKGMKLNMSAAGSAKHSQVAKENNKERRKFGEKTLPVLNDSSTPVPESISEKFSSVVTFKDIMEWCRDKNGKLIGIKVRHHPALQMWLEQKELRYLHKTMMRLGFRPKYETWYERSRKINRKFEPIRDGSKSMVWTHPTFNPESSVTDLTTDC